MDQEQEEVSVKWCWWAWDRYPTRWGHRPPSGRFSTETYAKTKELGPVGGRVPTAPLDPPLVLVQFGPYRVLMLFWHQLLQ